MNGSLAVLVIDDSSDDREAIVRLLNQSGSIRCQVDEADSGNAGLSLLRQKSFDCALLDFSMPGNNGLDVLTELKLRYADLPVVMMTGEGSERIAVDAMKMGAQDYVLKKDLSVDVLDTAVLSAMKIKRHEADILYRANYDELTGLANRRLFNERLDMAIERSRRNGSAVAVIFLDLDGFKSVNDSHGHDVGDELLLQIATRMGPAVRDCDTLARLGGDEFVVLLEQVPREDNNWAMMVSQRVTESIVTTPYKIGDVEVWIGVSSGMALYPEMAGNRSDLLRAADLAMYANKQDQKRQRSSANA